MQNPASTSLKKYYIRHRNVSVIPETANPTVTYYSVLPFSVVLPAASFLAALLLALLPLKGFRYRDRLLPAFLVVLLILEMIALVSLAVK